jgi:hypothetical protein
MANLSLIPEAAWREAERRAAVAECERGRLPFRAAEVEFDNLLKSTLKNDSSPTSWTMSSARSVGSRPNGRARRRRFGK